MNQSDSATEQPSSEKISQSREQSINDLVRLYFYSVILVVLAATIQIWLPARLGISGVQKDILGPLIAAIGVTFSYSVIKDTISAKFDADTEKIKSEAEKKSLEKNQKILEDNQKMLKQIDNSNIKHNLDFKYLAYIKPILGSKKLRLQEVSSKLREEYLENQSAFEDKLDVGREGNKTTREVRYIVQNLPDIFLQQLAVEGIAEALHLDIDDASERTDSVKDLQSLRVDIYAYLSAWLICSIDNDMGILMPIDCIGMRYTGRGNTPDREIYKNVIRAIRKIIAEGKYVIFTHYPDDDPLSYELVRSTIIEYLDQLIDLLNKYPLGVVKL